MTAKVFDTSMTRITDFRDRGFDTVMLPRDEWESGDYAVGQLVQPPRGFKRIETPTGRAAEVIEGDRVLGAFGDRFATLEAVGSWRSIGDDLRMHLLTAGGLLGRVTSLSAVLPPLLALRYVGHASRDGRKLNMRDFVASAPDRVYDRPTILLVGTSMSAGKTATARVIIHLLKERGLRVAGCKLSGAGRYRDILAMKDAGADVISDFVDVGLPSSICDQQEYRRLLRKLLSHVAASQVDVVVAEAGASPLEPYNGNVVVETVRSQLRCTVLCASDPYSVVGVMEAFQMQPDLVAGLATSTTAGIELVGKLTGVPAINVLDPKAQPALAALLADKLGLS